MSVEASSKTAFLHFSVGLAVDRFPGFSKALVLPGPAHLLFIFRTMPACALTPFDVTKYDMARLDQDGAVDLIRDLIHSEAFFSGIKANEINVPANTHSKDGGIDGVVKDASNDGNHGIIKKGTTVYQIKSGKFSPNQSCVRKILFNGSKLNDRIRACFEDGGTLVVAFTGWDAPTAQHERAEKEFRRQIEEAGFRDPRIEIWRQNQIIGFLGFFPPLQLSVKGLSGSPLRLHEEWRAMADMQDDVHLGQQQHVFIDSVRAALRGGDRAPIRVSGEPGIGKTRLVLEATDEDDLRPSVVYFERPRDLTEHGLLRYVCRAGRRAEAVLVVDECSFADQAKIWNALEYGAPGVRLITIYAEEDGSGRAGCVPAPPLEDAELEKIIRGYVGDAPNVRRWTAWCRPSPRVAHVIGRNLKYNPDDLFRPPNEVDIWSRYIAGSDASEEKIEKRRRILRWLGLFKRFGFESPHDGEAGIIAEMLRREEGIPRGEFMETIRELRSRKILQGSTTLYVTPKLLHLYLWRDWWETYSIGMFAKASNLIPQAARNSGDGNLLEWCMEMFAYAKLSPKAGEVVRAFLAPGGYMETEATLDTFFGAGLFSVFSRAEPAGALAYLQRTICKRSREQLLEFGAGRRSVMFALERIASRGEHLDGAARVLLKLAEAENEACANNATGVFQGMFNLGRLATKPDYLIRLLEDAMGSDSAAARKVAVGACNGALGGAVYFAYEDPDGVEPAPQPYEPTADEQIRYLSQVLEMLKGQDGSMPEGAAEVALARAHSLIQVPELAGSVADILERVRADGKNDEKLVECASRILAICKLGKETAGRLQAIMDGVSGSSFHSRMRRYVGMSEHVDMISDSARENRKKEFGALAKAAADPKVLEPELEWLVTCDAAQGYQFGYELAGRDPEWRLLPRIMGAMKGAGTNGKSSFAGGYLMRVREKDAARWSDELDAVYDSEKARWLLPSLVRLSGVTDESVKKVMRGVRDGKFGCNAMDYVINTGGVSAGTFAECIDLLAESQDGDAAFVALTMINFRLGRNDVPKETVLKVLLHHNLLNRTAESAGMGRGEWEWKEVGLEFLRRYPDESARIMEAAVSSIDAHTPLMPELGRGSVMAEIVRTRPEEAWAALSRHVGPPTDIKARMLQLWLAGSPFDRKGGPMSLIPVTAINAWIDGDEERAAHVASFLPNDFGHIREFLARYGDRPDVQRALAINFGREGWSGPGSEHYQKKKEEVDGLAERETDTKVLSWLQDYSRRLEGDIKRSSDSEEREF